MKGLSGKVALVTGAGGPMGFAVARRLAEEGMRLVLTDISGTRLEQSRQALVGAQTVALPADAMQRDEAVAVVDAGMQAFGAIGMTKELPLQLMQAKLRTMRIYDGPTEVHKWVVAGDPLGTRR